MPSNRPTKKCVICNKRKPKYQVGYYRCAVPNGEVLYKDICNDCINSKVNKNLQVDEIGARKVPKKIAKQKAWFKLKEERAKESKRIRLANKQRTKELLGRLKEEHS